MTDGEEAGSATVADRLAEFDRPYLRVAAVILTLAVFPALVPLEGEQIYRVLSIGVIWALFAVGYDVAFGYTGMVSFGHAAFFGLGGYGTTMLFTYNYFGFSSVWIALLIGIVAAVAFAVFMGYFSVQVSGVYLALVTFAFANVLYLLALADPCDGVAEFCTTNSFSGLTSFPPSLRFLGVELSLFDSVNFYYFALVLLVLSYVLVRRILATPLGATFRGIRENPERMEALGYDTKRFQLAAFVLSAAVSGLAGGLLAVLNLGVDPQQLFWEESGVVLLVTILGGPGTLIGPAVGGAAISILELVVSDALSPQVWRLSLGVIYVVLMLSLPGGMYEPLQRVYADLRTRFER